MTKINYINDLVGQKVMAMKFSWNSLILHFNVNSKDANMKSIRIYPFWRYEKNKKYVVGSSDFPKDEKGNLIRSKQCKEIAEIYNLMNALIGSKILNIEINKITNDICIELEKNQILRTFAAENYEALWGIRDRKNKTELVGFVKKIRERTSSL